MWEGPLTVSRPWAEGSQKMWGPNIPKRGMSLDFEEGNKRIKAKVEDMDMRDIELHM